MVEIEIPMAREIPIIVAEPFDETIVRSKWKCKMPFWVTMCTLCLAMLAFLMFVFWNQRRI
jgi:hypothetical protein